jgi:hypothetical protein
MRAAATHLADVAVMLPGKVLEKKVLKEGSVEAWAFVDRYVS